MSTNYPASLDSYSTKSGAAGLNSPDHAGAHNDLQDAVVAIETELGTDPAGAASTVKDRIAATEAVANAAQSAAEATAAAALTAHTTDASAAHAASAISNTPAGNLTATDVQAALDELQGDIDGLSSGTVPDDSVTNAKLANVATSTVKGRVAAGTGDPEDLTPAEVRTLINVEDGATADQSGAEIKAAYEAEADTNAFTDAEQAKLAGVEAGATADQSDAEIRAAVEAATDSNVFTDADHSKLDGVAAGATANSSDATLLARANHTGTQAHTTISDFDAGVQTNRLDQMAAPTAAVDMNDQPILQAGPIESRVEVASVTTTKSLDASAYGWFDLTMTGNTTFSFTNPAASGEGSVIVVDLQGAFTPTWPASVDWDSATAPTYASPAQFVFTTVDGGTIWFGSMRGSGFA